jgi:hypothetical protein
MSRRALPGLLLLLLAPAVASGQVRRGSEFVVNTYTYGPQSYPSVAAAADGRFVVVWQSLNQDGSNEGVFARRYSASGAPLGGSEFRVNAYTTAFQRFPKVASDASGAVVIVWESLGQDGSGQGIYGRRFDAVGGSLGGEFRVNATTTFAQTHPSVAMDAAGNFVVVWSSADGTDYDVMAQRYDAAGAGQGPEFRVNTYTTGDQWRPSVGLDGAGNFVVVWNQDETGVHGQILDAAGATIGGEFQVNTYTGGALTKPVVAVHAGGGFVVAWNTDGQYDGSDVMARRYFALGGPDGGEFQVNLLPAGDQGRAAVAADPIGNVVVTFDGDAFHDPDFGGVSARRYNVEGTPENFQFPINLHTTSVQGQSSVSMDANGHFVVVWNSTLQDGSAGGIVGQRFAKDLIFRDAFETGFVFDWSAAQTGGGDLSVSTDAALNFSTFGLQAMVNDTAGLYVQDDTPQDEDVYGARFYFDPNGFDPGESQAHRRTRVFIAFEELPTRRVMAIVLRRLSGNYALMGRVRQDDNSQVDTGFFPITDAPHWVEVRWVRSSGDTALDGTFHMFIDGVAVSTLENMDNSASSIDFVRMGALSVKTGAVGTMYWDEFESRRMTFIGPP